MSGFDRLERDLAVWFEDTAVPRVPDYVDEIIDQATRAGQRPRWSFVGRWLPGSVAGLSLPRLPIRWATVAGLIVLGLLLAAIVAFIGSRPRVPPPFGLANNGLVTYMRDGEIFTFDPASGSEVPLVTGFDIDIDPTWSLDGTRVAFIRQTANGDLMVFVDRDGNRPNNTSESLGLIDTDSVAWSPDGRTVAVAGGTEAARVLYFVDAFTGRVTRSPFAGPTAEPYWRPPDGRELMYLSDGADPGLWLYSFDDDTERKIVAQSGDQLRPRGWSPDGKRFVYADTAYPGDWFQTHLVDVASGETVDINAGPGRLSNDGTRVVAYRLDGERFSLCVAKADVDGGPCIPIGGPVAEPNPTHGDALNWSPDDEWVIVYPKAGGKVLLVDPDGKEANIEIAAGGAGSWQRLAP
jgi:dipeptidyl aminopeptidase/acylaminoacyl peptidase